MEKELVVLVHGLWMNGLDMTLLRRRFEHAGYRTRQFSYHTIVNTPVESATALNIYIKSIDAPIIHFVCHSLGGIIVRHLLHEYPEQRPGRIVTLGTPHQTSMAAQRLSRAWPGRIMLGKSMIDGLTGTIPPWKGSYEIGSIAGTLRLGMGMLIPGIPRPNDGTVAVKETEFQGMRDHISIAASHFGLLFSRKAAYQSHYFLLQGHFNHL